MDSRTRPEVGRVVVPRGARRGRPRRSPAMILMCFRGLGALWGDDVFWGHFFLDSDPSASILRLPFDEVPSEARVGFFENWVERRRKGAWFRLCFRECEPRVIARDFLRRRQLGRADPQFGFAISVALHIQTLPPSARCESGRHKDRVTAGDKTTSLTALPANAGKHTCSVSSVVIDTRRVVT